MRSRTVLVLASVVLLVAPLAAEAAIFTDGYVVPVVARGTGKGDTVWKTEICVTNPWDDYTLILRDGFVQDGEVLAPAQWQLPPGVTACTQDAVYDWLESNSWSGAYTIAAWEEDNPGVDDIRFIVAVKIYNTDPRGTFGQDVPMGSYPPLAWPVASVSAYGLVSGIQNYGTPNVDGYRTNAGVFNPTDQAQDFEFHAFDNAGNEQWSTSRTVPAMAQIQLSIPASVVIHDGALVGVNNGSYFMFPYVSIVDNKSGDGVYRPFLIGFDLAKRVQANPPGITVGPREAMLQLLRSVTHFQHLDGPRTSRPSPQE